MGAQSTIRRTPGGAREQTRRLIPLAPCPVEDCSVGGCTPRLPASPSNCSLRCSWELAARPLAFLYFFGTGSFTKVLATTALTPSSWACFTLETAPHLDSSNKHKSLYTGMTVHPAHSCPFATKGRTRVSSLLRHGVPTHGSPHSTAGRPTFTARCELTPARRGER